MGVSQQTIQQRGPVVRGLQYTYMVIAWIYVLCVAVQVYLAGLSLFDQGSWIDIHSTLGYLLFLLALLMSILAPIARFPRRVNLLALWLFLDVLFQVALVTFLRAFKLSVLTALHPVNALILFLLAFFLALRVQAWIKANA